jgi:hypothetical protein
MGRDYRAEIPDIPQLIHGHGPRPAGKSTDADAGLVAGTRRTSREFRGDGGHHARPPPDRSARSGSLMSANADSATDLDRPTTTNRRAGVVCLNKRESVGVPDPSCLHPLRPMRPSHETTRAAGVPTHRWRFIDACLDDHRHGPVARKTEVATLRDRASPIPREHWPSHRDSARDSYQAIHEQRAGSFDRFAHLVWLIWSDRTLLIRAEVPVRATPSPACSVPRVRVGPDAALPSCVA